MGSTAADPLPRQLRGRVGWGRGDRAQRRSQATAVSQLGAAAAANLDPKLTPPAAQTYAGHVNPLDNQPQARAHRSRVHAVAFSQARRLDACARGSFRRAVTANA